MPKATSVLFTVGVVLVAMSGCSRDSPTRPWPSRPVRIIVPFGAGTGSDLTARLFAARLAERWTTPVVVDNRPGADSVIGLHAFAGSSDQHTLLFATAGALTLTPLLHEPLPFDADRDLVPLVAATKVTLAIAATKTLAVGSLTDLVTLVRAKPNTYRWAAVTGLPELIFSAFLAVEKLQMTHVAYRDMSTALQDLGGGRIHVMVASVATMTPQLQADSARLLAVTSGERSAIAPHVPTALEAGYSSLTVDTQWGFFGWRGISDELRSRIAEDVRQAAMDTTLIERLAAMGQVVGAGGTDAFAAAIDRQRAQVATVARIVGLKPRGSTRGGDDVRVR